MLNLLSSLLNAITGGTTNIFMKILSMIGMGIFWKWFKGEEDKELKKQQDAKLDADINKSNVEAGKNALEAKKGAEINEEYLKQKRIINELKLKSRVQILPPDNIKVGIPFDIKFNGLPAGTEVMMDGKWNMGKINAQGYLKMILNNTGNREISVTIGEHVFTKKIEVKK